MSRQVVTHLCQPLFFSCAFFFLTDIVILNEVFFPPHYHSLIIDSIEVKAVHVISSQLLCLISECRLEDASWHFPSRKKKIVSFRVLWLLRLSGSGADDSAGQKLIVYVSKEKVMRWMKIFTLISDSKNEIKSGGRWTSWSQ